MTRQFRSGAATARSWANLGQISSAPSSCLLLLVRNCEICMQAGRRIFSGPHVEFRWLYNLLAGLRIPILQFFLPQRKCQSPGLARLERDTLETLKLPASS